MRRQQIRADTYRIIPSHFPPIALFENLLDPTELDAAYALESLTNDRLRDHVGDISLIPPHDRVTGVGTTPIMAAFTHVGIPSRFTSGQFGIYYAGLSKETALIESMHARSRFLSATNEPAQLLTMRCYRCVLDALLVDVRDDTQAQDPNSLAYSQSLGAQHKANDEYGILYRSVHHPDGECAAIMRPPALIPPALDSGHYQYHWDGNTITHAFHMTDALR